MSQKPETCTRKKVKVIGYKEYIDPDTGEIVPMQTTTVEERDFNFTKVWMRDFLQKLDLLGNAKIEVAFWIVDHIDKENQLTYTYRQIQSEIGCSLDTVSKTMKILIEADFLRPKNQGCYVLHPNIIFKGTQNARLNALTQYQTLGKEKSNPSKEEQLKNLLKSIEVLTRQANKLSEELKEEATSRESSNRYILFKSN